MTNFKLISKCRYPQALMLLVVSSISIKAQLLNPGFETPYQAVNSSKPTITGMIANGWNDNSAWADVTAAYSQETSNCHGGSSCQKVAVQAVNNGQFQMLQTIPTRAGRLYTPGVWVRGVAGTQIRLFFLLSGPPYTFYGDATAYLTDTWQFISTPIHMTQTVTVSFMVVADRPTTFWIDDASLADQAAPVTPLLANLRPSLPAFGMHINNYLSSQGPFNLDFEGPFRPVSSPRATITGQIGKEWFDNSDWADVTLNYQPNTTSPHGGASAQRLTVGQINSGLAQTVQYAALRFGQTYTASVWVRGTPGMQLAFGLRQWESPYTFNATQSIVANGAWQQITVSGQINTSGISVLMLQSLTTGTVDFDDVKLLDSTGASPNLGLPWPATAFGTWRLWDQAGCRWFEIEPQQGVWDFTLLDKAVADAEAHKTKILLTLGQTPAWASARPTENSPYSVGAAAEPRDINEWITYVKMVATRYRGRIFNYEIWNEPNDAQFFSGTPTQLAQLTKTAQQVLKAVDGRNVVISAAPYSVGYFQQYLALVGPYVDALGYHIYATPPEDDARVLADLRTVRTTLRLGNKPIIITEGASGDQSTTDETLAAGLLARKYLVEFTHGSSFFGWYTWGPATPFCLATTGPDGTTLSKAGKALGIVEGWLVGGLLQSKTTDAAGNWVIQLQTPNGAPSYIVWNPNGTASWTVPRTFRPVQVKDLFGGTTGVSGSTSIAVGTEPVLISSR